MRKPEVVICHPVRLMTSRLSPYTGIKTNLLFFTKGTPTEEVWYYEHSYPPGYKNYSKTRPMRIEEFGAEKAWWQHRVENEQAWKVSLDEIRARNFNLDIKNPQRPDAVDHDPDELLAGYAECRRASRPPVISSRPRSRLRLLQVVTAPKIVVEFFNNRKLRCPR